MKNGWTIFVAAALLLVSTASIAQQGQRQGQGQGKGGRPNMDERMARMTEELELSEGQASQIRAIYEEAQATRPNLRIMDREEARPVMCKHMLTTDRSVQDVLNEDQLVQYEEIKEARKTAAASGRGRGPIDCSEFETSE